MDKHILVIDAQDHNGVLSRIATVFNRRAMNIETFTAGSSETEGITRITLAMEGAGAELEIMKRQISKIIGVEKITELDVNTCYAQELLIAKLALKEDEASSFKMLVEDFAAHVSVDEEGNTLVRVVDKADRLLAFTNELKTFEILGYHRSGLIGI